MTIAESRAAVLAEAASFLGTPFHLNASLKGVGVDCARFLIACYEAGGIHLDLDIGHAGRDWFMHADDDRFISRVRAHGREIQHPEPGDMALFKIGHSWAHAAIIVDYPRAIHAKWNAGVQWTDLTWKDLRSLPVLFFSPWPEITVSGTEGSVQSAHGDGGSPSPADDSAICAEQAQS